MWQSFQPHHVYFIEHCKYRYKFAMCKIFFKELFINALILNNIKYFLSESKRIIIIICSCSHQQLE